MKVLLLGATGLVGSKLLELLINDSKIDKIHLISRRSCEIDSDKIIEFIGPLSEMQNYEEAFNVNSVYCCLGTTIKKAKSKENFRKVDYDFPLQAAKLAKKANVESFCVITALGASSNSSVFYNQVKGELEDSLNELSLNKIIIIRPSLIIGDRNEKRMAESIGIGLIKIIGPLFLGPIKKYAGSKVVDIASLMIALSRNETYDCAIEYQII